MYLSELIELSASLPGCGVVGAEKSGDMGCSFSCFEGVYTRLS